MKQKFHIGDKVRYNRKALKRHQVPQSVVDEFRHRSRIVVDTRYCPRRGRVFYRLGGRGHGQEIYYEFSSHQLILARDTGIGQPKKKRRRRVQAW